MTDRGRLGQWWLDRPVRAKGLIVLAVPLVVFVGVALARFAVQHAESRARMQATAAASLSAAADRVLVDGLNAETGVRGYALTRNPVFLAPYQLTLSRIGVERQALRAAAAAGGQARRGRAADAAAGRALAEIADLRADVAAGAAARTVVSTLAAGKKAMNLLRRQITALTAGPDRVAAAQQASVTSLETTINWLNISGLVLGLLGGLAGVALFTTGIARRVTAAADNADRLGAAAPLAPARSSRDEIGHLNDSHARADRLLRSRAADLTQARDEALAATRAKTAFLASTSHELRTPLNSILGFTQLLGLSDLDSEDRDSVARILAAGQHLLGLINDLIDTARIESGDLGLSVEPVPVLPVLNHAADLIRPLAAERQIALAQHCHQPGLTVSADQQRLSQILVNLLSNAVKYNHHGGAITITCHPGDGQVGLTVADTGPGTSPADLDRIFIPFERLTAATQAEGTGIGLPLAKALAEAMHGHLTVTSTVGTGSAFTLTLPRVPDITHTPPPEQPSPAPARPAAAHAARPASVLYIEDNPANIEVITRYLKSRPDITLSTAATGQAGLDQARRHPPDIILLDLHLPDLGGDQVLTELKNEPGIAAVPVVVLSADANTRVIRRLLDRGAHSYLTKPIDLSKLSHLLNTLTAPARRDSAPPPQPP